MPAPDGRLDLIQLRRDTATDWTAVDPILAYGEPGWDSTNRTIKIGDGLTPWSSLLPTAGLGHGATMGAPIQLNTASAPSGAMLPDRLTLSGRLQLARPRTLVALTYNLLSPGDGAAVVRLVASRVGPDGEVVGEPAVNLGQGTGVATGFVTVASINQALAVGDWLFFTLTNGHAATPPSSFNGTVDVSGINLGFSLPTLTSVRGSFTSAAAFPGAPPAAIPSIQSGLGGAPYLIAELAP